MWSFDILMEEELQKTILNNYDQIKHIMMAENLLMAESSSPIWVCCRPFIEYE